VRAGRTCAPPDDGLAQAYRATVASLAAAGYEQYEISNFCRPGKASRHNRKYWTDGWFGGFGLGAHGYAAGARRGNRKDLDGYLDDLAHGRDPVAERDGWDARRRLEEALILGLRLVEGIDVGRLGERYGLDVRAAFAGAWERAERGGLVTWSGPQARLTEHGRLCSNELFAELLGGTG
jgi:oxygen-independent coproporphyrinogen-3 oxidase